MVPEIAPEVVENMRSWDGHRRAADPSRPRLRLGARCVPVGGFSVDQSVRLPAGDQAGIERLTQYMTRCPKYCHFG